MKCVSNGLGRVLDYVTSLLIPGTPGGISTVAVTRGARRMPNMNGDCTAQTRRDVNLQKTV